MSDMMFVLGKTTFPPTLFDEYSGELRARDRLLTLPAHFGDGCCAEDVFVFYRRGRRDPPRTHDEGFGPGFGRRDHAAKDDARIVQAQSDFTRCTDHAPVVCGTRILPVHRLRLLSVAHVRGKGCLTLDLLALHVSSGRALLILFTLLGFRRFVAHVSLISTQIRTREDGHASKHRGAGSAMRGRPMFRLHKRVLGRKLPPRLSSVGRDARGGCSESRARSKKPSKPFRRQARQRQTMRSAESRCSAIQTRA